LKYENVYLNEYRDIPKAHYRLKDYSEFYNNALTNTDYFNYIKTDIINIKTIRLFKIEPYHVLISKKRDFMTLMKAVQVSSPGADFELVSKEIPEPKENEVLIKVEACGICHGDAVTKEGYYPDIKYPRVPGHEIIGKVDSKSTF